MEKRHAALVVSPRTERRLQPSTMVPHPSSSTTIWGSLLTHNTWRVESKKSFQRDNRGSLTLLYLLWGGGKKARLTRGGEEHKDELKSNFLVNRTVDHLWRRSEKPSVSSWATKRSEFGVSLSCFFKSVVRSSWKLTLRLAVHKLISCTPSGGFQSDDCHPVPFGGVLFVFFGWNVPRFSCPHGLCVKPLKAWSRGYVRQVIWLPRTRHDQLGEVTTRA